MRLSVKMSTITKKNITVYLESETIQKLDKLTKNYIFPNRSSLVNYCCELAMPIINKELKFLRKNVEIDNLPNVLNYLKERGFVIRGFVQPRVKIPLGNIHFSSDNKVKSVKVYK